MSNDLFWTCVPPVTATVPRRHKGWVVDRQAYPQPFLTVKHQADPRGRNLVIQGHKDGVTIIAYDERNWRLGRSYFGPRGRVLNNTMFLIDYKRPQELEEALECAFVWLEGNNPGEGNRCKKCPSQLACVANHGR